MSSFIIPRLHWYFKPMPRNRCTSYLLVRMELVVEVAWEPFLVVVLAMVHGSLKSSVLVVKVKAFLTQGFLVSMIFETLDWVVAYMHEL